MRRLIGGLALAALTLSACTGGGEDEPDGEEFAPAPAPAVELSLLGDLAEPLRLGVVVTSGGARGEGAEFAALAAGVDPADVETVRAGGTPTRGAPADVAAARTAATRLAAAPTRSLALSKRLVNASLEQDRATAFAQEAMAQELNMGTADANEGVASFVERRDPQYRGW